MNETENKNDTFLNLYNRSCRLATAVFTIANIIQQDEELKTKIKKLSLELVSMSVSLKDTDLISTRKLVGDIEKNSLLLMSILDIASVAGLISVMNGSIIKTEFQAFIIEAKNFSNTSESENGVSMKDMFIEQNPLYNTKIKANLSTNNSNTLNLNQHIRLGSSPKGINLNEHKRKDIRKGTILNFIKGHTNVNIKDIVPHIVGCSEKTIQREIIELINEGKISKTGERRWSRYSII